MNEVATLGRAEEISISMFSGDHLATHEFIENSKSSYFIPEQNLALAILEEALDTFEKTGPDVLNRKKPNLKNRASYQEVHDWFFERGMSGVFTFDSVCGYINVDPDYMRRGLKNRIEVFKNMVPPIRRKKKPKCGPVVIS